MSDEPQNAGMILQRIREQAASGAIRVTLRASVEMIEEGILLDDVLAALASEDAVVVEDYPEHRRGACCLVAGTARRTRPLHVVCTSAQPMLIVITVYEPKPPKWVTPTKRSLR